MNKKIKSYMMNQAKREEELSNYFNKKIQEIESEKNNKYFFLKSDKNKINEELELYKILEEKHFKNYMQYCNEIYNMEVKKEG